MTTTKYIKITVTFEFEEEQIKEMFEDYGIKFTKTKLKQLELAIQNRELELNFELEDQALSVLGDYINNEFGE